MIGNNRDLPVATFVEIQSIRDAMAEELLGCAAIFEDDCRFELEPFAAAFTRLADYFHTEPNLLPVISPTVELPYRAREAARMAIARIAELSDPTHQELCEHAAVAEAEVITAEPETTHDCVLMLTVIAERVAYQTHYAEVETIIRDLARRVDGIAAMEASFALATTISKTPHPS